MDRDRIIEAAFATAEKRWNLMIEMRGQFEPLPHLRDLCYSGVANRHYAMTMQTSFNRAEIVGTKLDGVASGVNSKAPPTVQDNERNITTPETAETENSVHNWVCLLSSLPDLPLSYPTRTRT